MTLLLTGYEPFGDHDRNPSAEVARTLDGERVADREIVGRVLPVEFDVAVGEMRTLIDDHDPEAILATGLAAGRAAVSVERVGINVADCAGTPDNADAAPRNERLCESDAEDCDDADGDDSDGNDSDGDPPAAYFATLPVVDAVEALLDAGVPARVSNTAGTHLCNAVLYGTRAYLDAEDRDVPAGFVHLPLTPEDAARKASDGEATSGGAVQPSLPLEIQQRAVRRIFETTVVGE